MSHDTPPRITGEVLASDAEREATIARLNVAVSEGRLTIDEFGDRSAAVYRARTRGELTRCLTGLPEPDTVVLAADPSAPGVRLALGSIRRDGQWRLPPVHRIAVTMGTVKLDLRDAAFAARVTDLSVDVRYGTVKVVVPAHVRLEVTGSTRVGSRRAEDNPLPESMPAMTVRLHVTTVVGSVKVYVADGGDRRRRFW
ncbi:uncharacterized protein DUF1707 [Stackebrandtia albiflava]|uniref:Uncharacterized protein DUF1707 n=1 Tax=Stackebrandtia albiflava TaxID=406432 RepID=A0A562V1E8_9ACTN|nr:DUF1707 domain-containing protein [Stackebrandtia albiflava]TWJ11632.1 uncharacterized protein DUF1707 [Stackebrandtia albiflava]